MICVSATALGPVNTSAQNTMDQGIGVGGFNHRSFLTVLQTGSLRPGSQGGGVLGCKRPPSVCASGLSVWCSPMSPLPSSLIPRPGPRPQDLIEPYLPPPKPSSKRHHCRLGLQRMNLGVCKHPVHSRKLYLNHWDRKSRSPNRSPGLGQSADPEPPEEGQASALEAPKGALTMWL